MLKKSLCISRPPALCLAPISVPSRRLLPQICIYWPWPRHFRPKLVNLNETVNFFYFCKTKHCFISCFFMVKRGLCISRTPALCLAPIPGPGRRHLPLICIYRPWRRHFRPKLVNLNVTVSCTPIDRELKMWFNEGSGSLLRPTIPELWRFLCNQLRRFSDKINTQT